MRNMILSNETEHQGLSSQRRGPRRPNQAQRRQQSDHRNAFPSQNPTMQGQVFQPRSNSRAHAPPAVAPHLRGIPPPTDNWRAISSYPAPNNGAFTQNQSYYRPPPQHTQLFNPAANGTKAHHNDRFRTQPAASDQETQVSYLNSIASKEVPKAAITVDELYEKQRLRESLEQACQEAVYEYEKDRSDGLFRTESVQLKCFGSLSTTFATKSSDMDLVLLSPLSQPDASSPESELPRVIEKKLLDLGYGARLLSKTRVPIIKFCEKPDPELTALLLAERAKFEKERDLPTPTKRPKVGKKLTKDDTKERPGQSLPQTRLSSVAEPLAISDGPSPSVVAESTPASSPHNAKTDGQPLLTANDGGQAAKIMESSEAKSPRSMQKEESDPSLLSKSDSERIRLYRLAIGEGWYSAKERKIISNYIQTLMGTNASDGAKDLARDSLKELPNVIGRYRAPPEHHLDFPKSGVGIQCDINFSNHLALHNSHMLKCYSLCDERVQQMVIFVKAWSKRRKINTPYHGTLSSYGYVLMVLHYLINIAQPPVLPNLQQTPLAFEDEMSASVVEVHGYNVQFLRNESAIEALLTQKKITSNMDSAGSLLQGFFHYYAQQDYRSPSGGFPWGSDTLSLRTTGGIISKQAKGWTGAKTETVELKGPGAQQTKEIRQRYLFAIEDPFETDHNIARTVVHNGIVAIRDEFRRAHRLVEYAGKVPGKGHDDLFAEAEDRENLQRSLFGPRPRNGADQKGNGRSNAGNGAAATNVAPVK